MGCTFGFDSCLEEIKIDKSGMDVWYKDSSSKKRTDDSG